MKAFYPRCGTHALLPVLLPLLLAGGAALAQDPTQSPRINRNPAYRETLPPAAPVPPDVRDSTTRPVQPPEQVPTDGRSVVEGVPAPQPAASAPARPASAVPVR